MNNLKITKLERIHNSLKKYYNHVEIFTDKYGHHGVRSGHVTIYIDNGDYYLTLFNEFHYPKITIEELENILNKLSECSDLAVELILEVIQKEKPYNV